MADVRDLYDRKRALVDSLTASVDGLSVADRTIDIDDGFKVVAAVGETPVDVAIRPSVDAASDLFRRIYDRNYVGTPASVMAELLADVDVTVPPGGGLAEATVLDKGEPVRTSGPDEKLYLIVAWIKYHASLSFTEAERDKHAVLAAHPVAALYSRLGARFRRSGVALGPEDAMEEILRVVKDGAGRPAERAVETFETGELVDVSSRMEDERRHLVNAINSSGRMHYIKKKNRIWVAGLVTLALTLIIMFYAIMLLRPVTFQRIKYFLLIGGVILAGMHVISLAVDLTTPFETFLEGMENGEECNRDPDTWGEKADEIARNMGGERATAEHERLLADYLESSKAQLSGTRRARSTNEYMYRAERYFTRYYRQLATFVTVLSIAIIVLQALIITEYSEFTIIACHVAVIVLATFAYVLLTQGNRRRFRSNWDQRYLNQPSALGGA